MSDLIIGLLLILVSMLMILQAHLFSLFIKKNSYPNALLNAIIFFIFVKLILYYFLPASLRLYSGFQFEHEDNIPPIDVLKLYLVEFISWFAYFSVMLILGRYAFKSKKFVNKEFSIFFMTFSVLGLVLTFLGTLFQIEYPPVTQIFSGIFFYCAIIAAPVLLIVYRQEYQSKLILTISVVGVIIGSLALTTRGAIVYMMLFFTFLAWYIRKDNLAKKSIIAMSGTLVVMFLISGGTPSIPVKFDDNGRFVIEFASTSEKNMGRTMLEEVEWRFGASTRMGTKFFVMYDRGDGAGILPIKHSLMGLLPRFLQEDKPIPSTVDPDDIYSMGMYLIYREVHGYDTYSMTEFPTGAHFYWEFGILGVIILSALSAVYMLACVKVYTRFGIAGVVLIVASFKPWGYMDPKIWISDAIIQVYQIMLPVLFLYFIYCTVHKIKIFFLRQLSVKKNA